MTNSAYKSVFLVCLVQAGNTLFCASATAQNTSEIGIGLGATNYRGEIAPEYQMENNRPAFTAFYRKDVTVPVTLRAGFMAGVLRADDANVTGVNGGVPPLSRYRQANTKGSVWEASGVLEYNFMDFHRRTDKVHFTPYLFAGIAGFYANTTTESTNQELKGALNSQGSMIGIAIPAGAGLKFAMTERLNLGLEVGVRKTFTDQLDHLSDQDPLLVNPHDKDWYYYSGVSLSYIFYKISCPPVYKKNKRLLK